MSSCTKCGYPVGNHPFRHPFAPVMAEALKPPAPESPYVPLHCGVGDLGELRTRNAALLAEVERLKADLAAVREALAGEREACDRWRGHWERDGYSARLANGAPVMDSIITHDQRRAAESIIVPPNRTGTPEESQAIADWHHDEIARRAAESKAAKEQT